METGGGGGKTSEGESLFSGFSGSDDNTASQIALAKVLKDTNNATMNSLGSNSVVLIEPKSSDLMKNPLKMALAIANSPLKELQEENHIKDIRTNKRRNLIVVELSKNHLESLETILKIDKLGDFEVEAHLPITEAYKYGVISPVDTDIDPNSLLELIKVREPVGIFGQDGNLVEVQRLKRKDKVSGSWVDSESLKLTYKGSKLPEVISICHMSYKVRPYVGTPLQCYNCQRLSHSAKTCTANTRCLLCSGNHHKDQCKAKTFKCANCGGGHIANSKECEYFSFGKKIEEVRIKESKTYLEAKNSVLNKVKSSSRNSQMVEPSISYDQSQGGLMGTSYRDKLAGPKVTESATQTDSKYDDDFFSKLTECLLTVLGSLNPSQGQEALASNIGKALRETFTPRKAKRDADGASAESQENSQYSEGESEWDGVLPKPSRKKSRKKAKVEVKTSRGGGGRGRGH